MQGVRARRAVPDTERVRRSRGKTQQRISSYPVEEWLTDDQDVLFDATKEAFPDITRAHFITDLHRVAREATDQLRAEGSTTGWIVHTLTGDGRSEDELSFWFERVPIDQCPQRRPRDAPSPAIAAPEVLHIAAATHDDPARVQAWADAVTAAYWCTHPAAAAAPHPAGKGPSFIACDCAGRTARLVTTSSPTPGWNPGDPIPAGTP